MLSLVSEVGIYEFCKDKLHLAETEAKKYAKQIASAEKKFHIHIRSNIINSISTELKMKNYITNNDLLTTRQELQGSMKLLENKIDGLENRVDGLEKQMIQFEGKVDARFLQFEAKMEKNAKDIVLLIVTLLTGIIGLAVAVIKLF